MCSTPVRSDVTAFENVKHAACGHHSSVHCRTNWVLNVCTSIQPDCDSLVATPQNDTAAKYLACMTNGITIFINFIVQDLHITSVILLLKFLHSNACRTLQCLRQPASKNIVPCTWLHMDGTVTAGPVCICAFCVTESTGPCN